MKNSILIMLLCLALALAGCGGTEPKEEPKVASGEVEKQEEPEIVEEEKVIEEMQQTQEISISWDDLKGEIIGESNKDYLEISNKKPTGVRNDNTGGWEKSTLSESVNIEEYLLSYQGLYMEEGDTHYIINFNLNTTTVVNYFGGLIYADIKEYENKEEHDAATIGGGMLLKSYIIYPDGDIEEVGV